MNAKILEKAKVYAKGYDLGIQEIVIESFLAGFRSKTSFEFDYSEVQEDFVDILNEWFEYKSAKGKKYKTQKSAMSCYRKLVRLSNGNAEIARQIVEDAMANNYEGLFKLKDNGQQQPTSSGQATAKGIFDFANQLFRE